jgi:hypothetical protein
VLLVRHESGAHRHNVAASRRIAHQSRSTRPEPSFLTDTRYDRKPLLRLLELYVLRAIGKLPASEEATLNAMVPNCKLFTAGREIGTKP